jgi:hypothetical protein
MKLVFANFFGILHTAIVKSKTGCLEIRILFRIGATCLSIDCFFSELVTMYQILIPLDLKPIDARVFIQPRSYGWDLEMP